MHATRTNQLLTLAGFAPTGKLNRADCGVLPLLEPFVWLGKRECVVFVLCAATTLPLPAQTLTTLFNFEDPQGASPYFGLVQSTSGSLYGTTNQGGANFNCGGYGCGTIFKISPGGAVTTVYIFCALGSNYDCPGGVDPNSALVQAANGDLYGATGCGGGAGVDGADL
jgi:uncharacterized repeat protein (TIGR03803 family)